MQTFWLMAEHGPVPIVGQNNDDIHESALGQSCCCQSSLFVAFKKGAFCLQLRHQHPRLKENVHGFALVGPNFTSYVWWQPRQSDQKDSTTKQPSSGNAGTEPVSLHFLRHTRGLPRPGPDKKLGLGPPWLLVLRGAIEEPANSLDRESHS